MKRCRLKHCNFQIINKMSKENKTSDKQQNGNGVYGVLTAGFIDDEILDKAIETWGIDAQLEMVIEECLELALALQKLKRLRGDMTQKEKNVIDEIADVKIMIKQAEKIFGSEPVNERVDFKMNRLKERLSEGVA